ncbi:E3 SUMO-protein ligase ZNF451 isoform X2 [Syngnathoides biaculeatus]|nr:E3 SUMO-protein ligase ZNF451 isoform X2 [Syngnathoides biaculeatus]XP_061693201.1 E3 SUMO-protein ligase ZNF451 isoform X2 [Syngnathoides biaculeatus]XP_061693202.1 E3 SUMO-protein ligase ZNF451 isoform X2 [Syngnathoides biaculeatus]XP_061693203.1 E3 SUMO-protein ligase ZNF451 isoform X2 [Syngnathoides biaculeatus]
MSSPNEAEEDGLDEVEFVCEGQLRPVLECVDLLTDSDEEGCSFSSRTIENKIDRQKAHVASTLDRLALQVAQEKQERADKCRAFKEKQIQQRVHGQQEIAFSSTNGLTSEAKRCVDMWLKMPGLQPGTISSGSVRRRRPVFPMNTSTKHTCPVINCGRVYDNVSLLDGHLKRFDHSPCDPTISLKGSSTMLFACVACCRHFQTKEEWRTHLESKVSSSHPEGHNMSQSYQRIVCFACPACYLLFNLRDECLQHMVAKKHLTESLTLSDTKKEAAPIPVSQHVKNRLITLCKDTPFTVRCSICNKVLTSHQAAQAHFNVNCRHGCAVAKAEETVMQVVKQLQVRGQCTLCCLIFLSQAEMEGHKEATKHEVEVNRTMERALLQYGRYHGKIHGYGANHEEKIIGTPIHRIIVTKRLDEKIPVKRQKLSSCTTAWFCECGLRFSEETSASSHLLAVNQIFYQCGVCGKHMGESSITRLHMSRFHGGAHLSNFFFYCRKCKVEMPRLEDIMSHVSEVHTGHTFFMEQEVPEDVKPSTSNSSKTDVFSSMSIMKRIPEEATSSCKASSTWMCRMCEDVFDSEASVRKHCGDLGTHSFQRFVCGHCPQKFFKESTVRRHCANEHDGQVKSAYFCGLCDSMQFESEEEFLQHYDSLHSKDYYCIDNNDLIQPTESISLTTESCPCMSSKKNRDEMKVTYTRCMKALASKGLCQYVCASCAITVPTYAQIKTHVHTTHAAFDMDENFEVQCQTCEVRFADVPKFHNHHHSQHCALEPCVSSRTCGKEVTKPQRLNDVEVEAQLNAPSAGALQSAVFKVEQAETHVSQTLHASGSPDETDEDVKKAMALSTDDRESAELEEALQRSLLDF